MRGFRRRASPARDTEYLTECDNFWTSDNKSRIVGKIRCERSIISCETKIPVCIKAASNGDYFIIHSMIMRPSTV